jgi:hypothetical protein
MAPEQQRPHQQRRSGNPETLVWDLHEPTKLTVQPTWLPSQSSIQPPLAFPSHVARAPSRLTERPMLPNALNRSVTMSTSNSSGGGGASNFVSSVAFVVPSVSLLRTIVCLLQWILSLSLFLGLSKWHLSNLPALSFFVKTLCQLWIQQGLVLLPPFCCLRIHLKRV